jgi:hypothetical protein
MTSKPPKAVLQMQGEEVVVLIEGKMEIVGVVAITAGINHPTHILDSQLLRLSHTPLRHTPARLHTASMLLRSRFGNPHHQDMAASLRVLPHRHRCMVLVIKVNHIHIHRLSMDSTALSPSIHLQTRDTPQIRDTTEISLDVRMEMASPADIVAIRLTARQLYLPSCTIRFLAASAFPNLSILWHRLECIYQGSEIKLFSESVHVDHAPFSYKKSK